MLTRSLYPLLCLLMLALAAPPAQTADCVVLQSAGGVTEYINVEAGDSVSGRISIYQDSNCETEIDYYLDNAGGFVYEDSLEDARDTCEKKNPDYLKGVSRAGDTRSGKQIYQCDVSPRLGNRSGRGRGLDFSLDGFRLDAFDGMDSGIVFQRRGPGAIGIQKVIDLGFLDAVDVWSKIGSGFSVCFPQTGRVVFLEAATSPRTLHYPEYHHEDGFTCASMTTAGTMVLVDEPEDTTVPTTATRRPDTEDDIADAIDLEDCTVTTPVNLNLRQGPWGQILDTMPADTEVTVTARTDSWFKVTYGEVEGWSAAWLVTTTGDCD